MVRNFLFFSWRRLFLLAPWKHPRERLHQAIMAGLRRKPASPLVLFDDQDQLTLCWQRFG